MALQDLTPQLRTRLSRMERAVGWFVFLATALLLFGFGYYVYHVAEQKGWFKMKAKFHTYIQSSTGLNVGDPVVMMGFSVGQILSVHPMEPRDPHNVEVTFEILEPYFRYIWSQGSVVKVNAADFLGKRQIEITRGTNGYAIVVTQPVSIFTNISELQQLVVSQPDQWQLSQDIFDENSNLVFSAYTALNATNLQRVSELTHDPLYAYNNTVNKKEIVAAWHPRTHRYEEFTPENDAAWLKSAESPAVTEQLQAVVTEVQNVLPVVLTQLTNVLSNASQATSNLNLVIAENRPALQSTLMNADLLLAHLDTNVTATLVNLADITSNLDTQVQANSNMLSGISKTVTDSDSFIQGLKHHWLLRSAFKNENKKTNAPPVKK
ncbi:MAG TPA: MlaD family protein [Dongiaceae bacterium]|nr:MlaD family protein [Dongiaceae bacterium]